MPPKPTLTCSLSRLLNPSSYSNQKLESSLTPLFVHSPRSINQQILLTLFRLYLEFHSFLNLHCHPRFESSSYLVWSTIVVPSLKAFTIASYSLSSKMHPDWSLKSNVILSLFCSKVRKKSNSLYCLNSLSPFRCRCPSLCYPVVLFPCSFCISHTVSLLVLEHTRSPTLEPLPLLFPCLVCSSHLAKVYPAAKFKIAVVYALRFKLACDWNWQ